jgi:hypothetical protein
LSKRRRPLYNRGRSEHVAKSDARLLEHTAQNWPTRMDARNKFKAGIAYDDLRERLARADGRLMAPQRAEMVRAEMVPRCRE